MLINRKPVCTATTTASQTRAILILSRVSISFEMSVGRAPSESGSEEREALLRGFSVISKEEL
jgi:hypothetical protein